MYDEITVEHFEALTKNREENAAVLEKPSMRGVQRSVVEKYSETAHFVYELIQNADDAAATYARFVLKDDGLIFAHDGTRQFTVSNPENEDQDCEAGKLGDINAITSIANSNKTEASIGKFGVGFKAVFQYTSTPHIYCQNIAFKIERFIVPKLLCEDSPIRKDGETLFVFPFDRDDMPASCAIDEITERLKSLAYPVLFLNNLQKVIYETDSAQGEYSKEVIETYECRSIKARLVNFKKVVNDSSTNESIWLLSSVGESGYTSTVGFFLDEEGCLTAKKVQAYCFFPTKLDTSLSFMINAPFLLTDSREGIKYSDPHNVTMIEELGNLACNALLALRDIGIDKGNRIINDNMFDVIPYKTCNHRSSTENDEFFNPIIVRIKKMLSREDIFPGEHGYWKSDESYILESGPIAHLIDETLLNQLIDRRSQPVGLVLKSVPATSMKNELSNYLRSIGIRVVSEKLLLDRLSPTFIKQQTLEQLSHLHAFFAETAVRTEAVKQKPIFIDVEGETRAAFDSNDVESLFLPSEDSDGYHVLSEESLSQEGTLRLVEAMELKRPSLEDKIFNRILPKMKQEGPRNEDAFRTIFKCYASSEEEERKSFINNLSKFGFIAYKANRKPVEEAAKPNELYLPLNRMDEYFAYDHAKFVDLDYYQTFIDDKECLVSFFEELGVATTPRLISRALNLNEAELTAKETGIEWDKRTKGYTPSWDEKDLDGLRVALLHLDSKDVEYSSLLWDVLIAFIETACKEDTLSSVLTGTYEYYCYKSKTQKYVPLSVHYLRNKRWLFDHGGNAVAPFELSLDDLSDRYDTSSKAAQELADFLGFERSKAKYMSADDRKILFVENLAKGMGVSPDELMDNPELLKVIKGYLDKKFKPRNSDSVNHEASIRTSRHESSSEDSFLVQETIEADGRTRLASDIEQQHEELTDGRGEKSREESFIRDGEMDPLTKDIVKRISKRRESRHGLSGSTNQDHALTERQYAEDEIQDADDYTPPEFDYSRRSKRLKEEYARKIDDLSQQESLWNEAVDAEKYTYKWFKTLITLESFSDTGNSTKTEMVIAFGSCKLDAGTSRTLVLEQPNRGIPSSIEDIANIPLILDLGNRSRKVEIEVASVRAYTLYARLKDGADLSGINLDDVVEARIEVRNPTFLLEELRKHFEGLSYKNELNLRDNLPSNIKFIFGPPGTGKTTYLAKDILLPIMKAREGMKVLVLAPTNKAADVLARKIIDCANDIDSCRPWLVRFGMTADESLEDYGIYRDKTYDFTALERNVVVTTIARYPYDYVMTENGHKAIRSMDWDYVIIDEASMITCAEITYVLHNAHPREFIIAGDPHQIEPVARVSLWKDESIYTMTGLKSFASPKTVPHDYPVVLLKTQYRSMPAIGTAFSELSYEGLLSHARKDSMTVRSHMDVLFDENPISIIKFPVSRYESIYRPKRLGGGSSYQPYSALLTFELVRHIASTFSEQAFSASIGVVSPYKAQADLINGLLVQTDFPDLIRVRAGTIHGFQGDECDVMIVVLNPPPNTSSSKEMFLNKRNILNVSISRARDSLILLTPNDDAPSRANLREISRLERICRETGSVSEYSSSEIEEKIFGTQKYIADNSFTTGHQAVNVYGRPEQLYEVRCEELAIDIQVHNTIVT